MSKLMMSAVFGLLLTCGFAVPANAGETGIAAIHAWVQSGKKTCIQAHWHTGSGSGYPTKQAAEMEAINVWINFTALDYGTDWMSYRLAESKTSKCEKSSDGWACIVEARACKLTPAAQRSAAVKR